MIVKRFAWLATVHEDDIPSLELAAREAKDASLLNATGDMKPMAMYVVYWPDGGMKFGFQYVDEMAKPNKLHILCICVEGDETKARAWLTTGTAGPALDKMSRSLRLVNFEVTT